MDSVYMICSKITMKFLMLYDDDSYHWNCEGCNLHKYGNGVNENNSTKSTKIYITDYPRIVPVCLQLWQVLLPGDDDPGGEDSSCHETE